MLATLADVAERAAAARASARRRSRSSAPVAALREQLAWLEARPLHGRTVAVTRARAQASALAARLRELGAAVVEAPAIRIAPLDAPSCPTSRGYDLVVRDVAQRRRACCSTACATRASSPAITVAAIGPGTARALRERGVEPDVVPERAVAEGLVEALARRAGRARAGRPRAPRAATCCPTRCASAAPRSTSVALYETVAEPLDDATRDAAAAADYVLFTSASSVRFFARRGAARSRARGWSRSARRRAPSCARTAPSRTSRPTRTRPTASSRRCSRDASAV